MRSVLVPVVTLVAILLLTAPVLVGIAVVDSAVEIPATTGSERTLAASEADRLVADDGPVAVRSHVIDANGIKTLSSADLSSVQENNAVTVQVNGDKVVDGGPSTDGTTVERVVLLRHRESQRLHNDTVVVPSGVTRVHITHFHGQLVVDETPLATGNDTDPPVSVAVTPTASTRIAATGNVTVTYDAVRHEPAVLAVTVSRGGDE